MATKRRPFAYLPSFVMGAQLNQQEQRNQRGAFTQNEPEPETTLQQLEKRSDGVKSEVQLDKRRERELEELLERAKSLSHHRRPSVELSVSEEAVARSQIASRSSKHASLGENKHDVNVLERTSEIRRDHEGAAAESKARDIAGRIVPEAMGARADLLKSRGQINDMIRVLGAELPPEGVSYTDWMEKRAEREKIVAELYKTRAELDSQDSELGGVAGSAETLSIAGTQGEERRVTTKSRRKAA